MFSMDFARLNNYFLSIPQLRVFSTFALLSSRPSTVNWHLFGSEMPHVKVVYHPRLYACSVVRLAYYICPTCNTLL